MVHPYSSRIAHNLFGDPIHLADKVSRYMSDIFNGRYCTRKISTMRQLFNDGNAMKECCVLSKPLLRGNDYDMSQAAEMVY